MSDKSSLGRPWIKLSSLGTRIVLFFVALLVLVQGLGAFLVIQANSQIARQTIDQELEQGERVFSPAARAEPGAPRAGRGDPVGRTSPSARRSPPTTPAPSSRCCATTARAWAPT